MAIVTGAARRRSIGGSIATTLAGHGATLVVTGSTRGQRARPDDEEALGWEGAESLVAELRAAGTDAMAVSLDIAEEDQCEALVASAIDRFGRVDVLVHSAATPRTALVPIAEMPTSFWSEAVRVNLDATFFLSRAVARHLRQRRAAGRIVLISSVTAKQPSAGTAAYAATKAGVNSLARCLALELADIGTTVNAVCPGLIDTARHDDIRGSRAWDDLTARLAPLGHAGRPEDVADFVAYLCSDHAAWITGQAMNVDGGALPF